MVLNWQVHHLDWHEWPKDQIVLSYGIFFCSYDWCWHCCWHCCWHWCWHSSRHRRRCKAWASAWHSVTLHLMSNVWCPENIIAPCLCDIDDCFAMCIARVMRLCISFVLFLSFIGFSVYKKGREHTQKLESLFSDLICLLLICLQVDEYTVVNSAQLIFANQQTLDLINF